MPKPIPTRSSLPRSLSLHRDARQTLRQRRRMIERARQRVAAALGQTDWITVLSGGTYIRLLHDMDGAASWGDSHLDDIDDLARELDRLIGYYGPDALVSDVWQGRAKPKPIGEFRPKGTDEVDDTSDDPSDAADKHGGDGNSCEVEAEAETSPDDPDSDESGEDDGTDGPDDGAGGDNTGEGEADGGSGGSGAGNESDAASSGEEETPGGRTNGAGDPGSDAETADDSNCQHHDAADLADATGDAGGRDGDADHVCEESGTGDHTDRTAEASLRDQREHDCPAERLGDTLDAAMEWLDQTDAQSPARCGGVSAASRTARESHGGISAIIAELGGSRVMNRTARRFVRRVMRWMQRHSLRAIPQDCSPRIDGGRLVTELASRRCRLSAVRRREIASRPALIMCDVSGSCCAVSAETLAACVAIQEAAPEMVQVVVHSNGYPVEMQGRFLTAPIPQSYIYDSENADKWCRWYRVDEWSCVVNFGDWDAGWLLSAMSHYDTPIIWLDSYRCSCVDRPYRSRDTFDGFGADPIKFDGVNSLERALDAITIATKETPCCDS